MRSPRISAGRLRRRACAGPSLTSPLTRSDTRTRLARTTEGMPRQLRAAGYASIPTERALALRAVDQHLHRWQLPQSSSSAKQKSAICTPCCRRMHHSTDPAALYVRVLYSIPRVRRITVVARGDDDLCQTDRLLCPPAAELKNNRSCCRSKVLLPPKWSACRRRRRVDPPNSSFSSRRIRPATAFPATLRKSLQT